MKQFTEPAALRRYLYHAKCATCGYVGRAFDTEADAETDGDEHEIAVGTNRQHHYTRVVTEGM